MSKHPKRNLLTCLKRQVKHSKRCKGKILEAIYAAFSALAARSEMGTLEDELVRDLVILRMKKVTLQDTLIFETLTPEEVLKKIIKFEDSKKK